MRHTVAGPFLATLRQGITTKATLLKALKSTQVPEGERIPDWHGIAYWGVEETRDAYYAVTYPIPVNLVVGLWHVFAMSILHFMKFPPWRFGFDAHQELRRLRLRIMDMESAADRLDRIAGQYDQLLKAHEEVTRGMLEEFRGPLTNRPR